MASKIKVQDKNGSDSKNLQKYSGKSGQAISNPYRPEQNGCAERTNRTVVELARTMLLAKNMPKHLWAEAINTAVYILNRSGSSGVEGKIPFELFTGKNVNFQHFHMFGSDCFVHVPKQKRQKWDKKGKRGIFIGYSNNVDGFRVWHKSENRVVCSKDVVFEPEQVGKLLALFPNEVESKTENDELMNVGEVFTEDEQEPAQEIEEQETESTLEKRQLRDRNNLKAPDRLSYAMLNEVIEPKDYNEAIHSTEKDDWIKAMDEEMTSLKKNSTWKLVELPKSRKAISNRWVSKVKRAADGEISRFKARLVVHGYSQREGIDFNETFSPVARLDSIRTVLSIAAREKLELIQFDIKTGFLYGEIKEDIYMKQPEGYQDGSQLSSIARPLL